MQVMMNDDILWVQDYQLMLLPLLIRKRFRQSSIGYFLHIPFPSFELFQTLPSKWVNELLNGILGADLIGFHTFDYSQHFLRCVFRMLGHEHNLGQISTNNRLIKVETFPMGINFKKFSSAALHDPVVGQARLQLREQFTNVKVIFSIDRLDYSKGILQRLQGYEKFLEMYPQWNEKVVLVLVVAPSRINIGDYQLMKYQIDEHVGRINGKFGKIHWTPIVYQAQSLTFEPLVALYSISDIALVTPLRDGMNLIAKEYVASRADSTGVLILSKMAGASAELGEAILVNPNHVEEIAEAIDEALEMPIEKQIQRMKLMQKRLQRYNVVRWATYFIETLLDLKKEQSMLSTKIISPEISTHIVQDFKKAHMRLIILDYDGTLVPFTNDPQKAFPTKDLLALLKSLSTYPNTFLALISGRDKETLQTWFNDVNMAIMAAEHGVWIKEQNKDWYLLKPVVNTWKEKILPILEMYTDRLPGSLIEEKTYSIAWHYRGSDSELGSVRAKELMDVLVHLTNYIAVQVIQGNKVIEIRNAGIDKGSAVTHILENFSSDFLLCIGDDWTDEDMFKVLPKTAYTIRVGISNSAAQYTVHSSEDIINLLTQLIH